MSSIKKLWKFIWHSDSILAWIINIILAFLIVKFLIYPGLGFAFSTSHPLVAVVSNSMHHDSNFEDFWETKGQWYESRGITKQQFKTFSFKNGFNKGDIMLIYGTKNIDAGDIIVYNGGYQNPIIHRVIEENVSHFKTKGDNNPQQDPRNVTDIIGKAIFKIPFLGWVKIIFIKIIGG